MQHRIYTEIYVLMNCLLQKKSPHYLFIELFHSVPSSAVVLKLDIFYFKSRPTFSTIIEKNSWTISNTEARQFWDTIFGNHYLIML